MSLLSDIEDALRDELGPPSRWPGLKDLRVGVYLAGALLEGGDAGLAYVPHLRKPAQECCPPNEVSLPPPGAFCERPASDLLELRASGDAVLESVGMAVLNALCGRALGGKPRAEALDGTGGPADPMELLNPGPEDVVGLVGAMTPYLVRLGGRVKDLHLFERDVPMVREEHRQWLREEKSARELLPLCTLVVITGAALANGSLDGLLPSCRRAREVAVVGPTASVIPEPLFRRGVTILGGVEVVRPEVMMRVISEGGSGRALDNRCVRKRTFRSLP